MWEVSPPSAECLMYTVTPTVTQCGPVTALEVRIGIGTYWYWYVLVLVRNGVNVIVLLAVR